MASNLSQPDKAKRFTDCPHCGSLCLGPVILPCGHVTCRRCLGHLLQNKKPCPVCEISFPVGSDDTVSQCAQRFSSELVLRDLVNERLHDLGQQSCEVCQNRDATTICQDCGEMYCDGCASAHRKMRATKEHVQQPLPHALQNTSQVNRPQIRIRRRPPSPSSIVSGDSITNLPRAPTTTGERDRQWIDLQVQMFEQATNDVQNFGQAAQGLADEAKEKEKILSIYTNRLANAELRKDNDGHVCVSGLSDDDVTTTVKSQDLLPRLLDVRESCGKFDVMEMLQAEYLGLVTGDKAVLEEQMAGALKEAGELRVKLREAEKALREAAKGRQEENSELMDLRRRMKMIDSEHSKLETEVADLRLRVAQDEKREEEAKRTHFDLSQKVKKAESSRKALCKELANLQGKMAELIDDATTKKNDSRIALDVSRRSERKQDDQLASADREEDEALATAHGVTTELKDMDEVKDHTDKGVKVPQTNLGDAERVDSTTMSGCIITSPSTAEKETRIGNCSICRSVGACSCDSDSADLNTTDYYRSTKPHSTEIDSSCVAIINMLKDEQERIQKKAFTNWMNTYLCQRKPPIVVKNLFEEIKDGVLLLSLLEALSGDKLPKEIEKGAKLCRLHHIANISTALRYIESKEIRLVNINATSVADGKPAIVLGLVWTIILYFQIEDTIYQVSNDPDMEEEEPSNQKKQALPKQSLLAWSKSILVKKYGLEIKNFHKSWKDGVAFNAMIHNIRPDLVDMDIVRRQQDRVNLEHAFSTAEDKLGIARLLDPEDVDVDRPDEKSIMTYVAQFLKAYPDAGDPNVS